MADGIKIACEYEPIKYGPMATLAQSLATTAQSFLSIGLGIQLAIPAIVIRHLYGNNTSDFSISLTEASWYGSILYIIHPFGCFLSGVLQDRFGKKRCMIFANVPSITGWILLYFAHSSFFLYTSTLLMGFSIGVGAGAVYAYIGEITEPRLRGSMASILNTASLFGSLLGFILGSLFDWRTVALLSALCQFSLIMAEIKEQDSARKYGPKATLAQCLATVAQSFLFIGLGMNLSISAIVIRDLYRNPNGEFSITITEASWYGSLLFISHPVGCLLSGILQNKFGKKRCMILANVPSILGWVLLYSANSSVLLCASTLLMGFSTGFGAGSTSSYVGEISEPRLRGSLGSLGSTAMRIGTLLMYILGLFFDWRTVALYSIFCPIICIFFILFIPESPIWLIAKGRNDKAKKAMCWLRGWVEPEQIKPEFLELVHYNEVSGTQGGKIDVNDKEFFSNLSQFKNPAVYRPLRLMLIIFFVSFIVSVFPTRPFITKIMKEVDLFDNQNESLVLLTGLTSIGCIIATAIVHRTGKRLLTMLTLSINTVLLLSFGAYIILFKTKYISSSPLISLTFLCGIYFFGSCGISCIPWMILIEVFPNKSRGVATSTTTGLAYIILFTLTKSYLIVEMYLSLEYTMILFGCVGIFGFIYIYFYLPETENKTLLEIEEFFVSTKNG